jgi:hypothetical protein
MLDRPSSRLGLDLESNWRYALDCHSRKGEGCCGSGAAAHHCGHRERNLGARQHGAEVPATAAKAR